MALTPRVARALRLYERLLCTVAGDTARALALTRRIDSALARCSRREVDLYYQHILKIRQRVNEQQAPAVELIEWP